MPPYCDDCGTHHTIKEGHRARRVLVPEGMTVEDAQQALTDARPWVPLPDGVQKEHIGARLRCEFRGVVTEGKSTSVNEYGIWTESGGAIGQGLRKESWFIHPDDVPDPDAAVLDALARLLADEAGFTWPAGALAQRVWVQRARAALAVVRQHEATR